MQAQAIALLDCNNFYASCERAFAPRLDKKPVVVLSNNDGCVVARSDEAKKAGVTMGAPLFKIEEFLEEIDCEIFSSNYELYGDMSHRVMEFLKEFSPMVEVYSIDEAFLGLDACGKKSLDFIGRDIREKIYKWTKIPTSIGIAETKTLSKIANKLAKKSDKAGGVLDLYKSPYTEIALDRVPVEDVWGIGRAYAAKLKEEEVFTALALRDLDLRWARKNLSVQGARIVMELRGQRCFPLDLNPPPRRHITCSRTFGKTVENLKSIREAVAVFVCRAAEKMRRHNLAANSVTVFIGTDRFHPVPEYYSDSAVYKSAYHSDVNHELIAWAFHSLSRILKPGYAYRKAGVILGGLTPADKLTTRMFDDEHWERYRNLMKAIDEINRRWGRDTVRLMCAEPSGEWQMKAERRSPRFTTRFDEIAIVH